MESASLITDSSPSTGQKRRIVTILLTYALRLAGQGIAFFLFARVLGAGNFGYVVAALAILSPISPFVDMGAYSIVSRDIALGHSPIDVISENLTLMLLTLPLGIAVSVLISHFTNPNANLLVILMISIAYLSISRTSSLLAAIQNTMTQKIPVIWVEAVSAILLVSIGIFGLIYGYSLLYWSISYAFTGLTVVFLSLFLIKKYIGEFQLNFWPNAKRIKEGFTFSVGNSFQYIYTDVDKVVLLRFASADLTGVYGMATRIGSIALIPIGAVYSIFYPRFMKSGHGLDIPIRKLLGRVLVFSSGYAVIAVLVLLSSVALIPRLLGPGYAAVPGIIHILTISVAFQIFQTPFADTITGLGFQTYRTLLQGIACVIALSAAFILIPGNPRYGVVEANLIVHGSLLLMYVFVSFHLLRRHKNSKKFIEIDTLSNEQ